MACAMFMVWAMHSAKMTTELCHRMFPKSDIVANYILSLVFGMRPSPPPKPAGAGLGKTKTLHPLCSATQLVAKP